MPAPIRLAANSADTFTFAGRHGYPIFAGGPVNPIPVLAERLQIYERALKAGGHQRPDDWLAAALMVFVGRDRAEVRATIRTRLAAGDSRKDVVRMVTERFGLARNDAYQLVMDAS